MKGAVGEEALSMEARCTYCAGSGVAVEKGEKGSPVVPQCEARREKHRADESQGEGPR